MNSKWIKRYLELAEHVACWSKDPSTKCGAVIVRPDKSVVSVGFNGFPKNMDDDEILYNDRETKYERIIHCEMNAILNANTSVSGNILFVWPFLCCPRCAMHVIQVGIIKVVAPACPPDKQERWGAALQRSLDLFKEANVEVVIVDESV